MDTPAHIRETAQKVIDNLLPKKSSNRYWKEYELFIKWSNENGINSFNEFVLLASKSKNFMVLLIVDNFFHVKIDIKY
jgi:hypothetical protein